MKAFGRLEVTTTELPDELCFRVEQEFGWVPLAALPGIFLGMVAISPFLDSPWVSISIGLFGLAVIGVVMIFAPPSARKGRRTTTLSVTSQRLEVTGAVQEGWPFGRRRPPIVVLVSELQAIEYVMGGEDTSRGLYARKSWWKSECLLPGLSRLQCNVVTEGILSRFPEIAARTAAKK